MRSKIENEYLKPVLTATPPNIPLKNNFNHRINELTSQSTASRTRPHNQH